MDRRVWQATVHEIPRVRHDLVLSFFQEGILDFFLYYTHFTVIILSFSEKQ